MAWTSFVETLSSAAVILLESGHARRNAGSDGILDRNHEKRLKKNKTWLRKMERGSVRNEEHRNESTSFSGFSGLVR